jgi:hypothetical protein
MVGLICTGIDIRHQVPGNPIIGGRGIAYAVVGSLFLGMPDHVESVRITLHTYQLASVGIAGGGIAG